MGRAKAIITWERFAKRARGAACAESKPFAPVAFAGERDYGTTRFARGTTAVISHRSGKRNWPHRLYQSGLLFAQIGEIPDADGKHGQRAEPPKALEKPIPLRLDQSREPRRRRRSKTQVAWSPRFVRGLGRCDERGSRVMGRSPTLSLNRSPGQPDGVAASQWDNDNRCLGRLAHGKSK